MANITKQQIRDKILAALKADVDFMKRKPTFLIGDEYRTEFYNKLNTFRGYPAIVVLMDDGGNSESSRSGGGGVEYIRKSRVDVAVYCKSLASKSNAGEEGLAIVEDLHTILIGRRFDFPNLNPTEHAGDVLDLRLDSNSVFGIIFSMNVEWSHVATVRRN